MQNPCRGDLNGDLRVDDADFILFAKQYETFFCEDSEMPLGCPSDFTGDGFVDDSDFVRLNDWYNVGECW